MTIFEITVIIGLLSKESTVDFKVNKKDMLSLVVSTSNLDVKVAQSIMQLSEGTCMD